MASVRGLLNIQSLNELTYENGSSYRMDGSVADTTCSTQAVDRQKVKAKDEFHETARITANRYA